MSECITEWLASFSSSSIINNFCHSWHFQIENGILLTLPPQKDKYNTIFDKIPFQ